MKKDYENTAKKLRAMVLAYETNLKVYQDYLSAWENNQKTEGYYENLGKTWDNFMESWEDVKNTVENEIETLNEKE